MHREPDLAAALIELADIHGKAFDEAGYTDLLARRAAVLLDADSAGVLLTGADGALTAIAASTETARVLQLIQLRVHDGPGITCFRNAAPVSIADLREDRRWDTFRSATLTAGFTAVHAVPLGLREQTIGSLSLFRRRPGPLEYEEDRISESLAAIAGAGLLSKRALAKAETLSGQLQTALHSRIVIEQAKGILAERHGIAVDRAFERMRSFARHDRRRLDDVARAVIGRNASVAGLAERQAKPSTL
ncbi:MAG TPA: GAF and ANTAR domain-containing protein [Amycolatopsis sp.]|nr:GAF and ANTAR domain-containing protein [Amycolatopsis sp.]